MPAGAGEAGPPTRMRAFTPPCPRIALKPPGPNTASMREQGSHGPVTSSATVSPMRSSNGRSRNSASAASRFSPDTTRLRRNCAASTGRPVSAASTGRCSA